MSHPNPADVISVISKTAEKIRGPWQFGALVVLILLAVALNFFSIVGPAAVVLIVAIALPILVFALMPWKPLAERRPGGLIGLLIILVFLCMAGLSWAAWLMRPPSASALMLRGVIEGLTAQADMPLQLAGRPRVQQSFDIAREPDGFYQSPESFYDLPARLYRRHWLLVPDREPHQLVLVIHQEWGKVDVTTDYSSPEPTARLDTTWKSRSREFVLDLDAHPSLRTERIHLTFVAANVDPEDSVGSLLLKSDSGDLSLPLGQNQSGGTVYSSRQSLPYRFIRMLAPRDLWAQQMQSAPAFDQHGNYSRSVGDFLSQRLQSSDWTKQQAARAVLTDNSTRSCKFVTDHLSPKVLRTASDRGALINSLATAVREIESHVSDGCTDAYLPFALAYYDIRDFPSSAGWFDKVRDKDLVQSDWWYYRGFAYWMVGGRDERAIASLTAFLTRKPSRVAQASTHTVLGYLYLRTGQKTEAARHYRAALNLNPTGAVLADASNNLAFTYGELFPTTPDSLERALGYVDRALAISPDNPSVLDTKGWLLYRLGRCGEAVTLLRRAAAGANVYHAHRDSVQQALTSGRCK